LKHAARLVLDLYEASPPARGRGLKHDGVGRPEKHL